ncbi:hypothetical protein PUN28_008154 [Cardiocondyla obscurior]|uniref:Uncharacterized protein n=1 Tax=Cardiocondyla obscurior TaxID=286306 RepID=A0AAW2G2M4_9HYME
MFSYLLWTLSIRASENFNTKTKLQFFSLGFSLQSVEFKIHYYSRTHCTIFLEIIFSCGYHFYKKTIITQEYLSLRNACIVFFHDGLRWRRISYSLTFNRFTRDNYRGTNPIYRAV